MVSVVQRMRKLKTLQNIRLGPGAAILPSSSTPSSSSRSKIGPITRLHLSYAQKIYGGHQGARKFWRICLPRLKYHNPALPVTVKQTGEESDPAVMTIYYNSSPETAWEKEADSSTPPAPTTTTAKNIEDKNAPMPAIDEKTVTLDMKDKEFEKVWASFREMTGAEEVKATEEDKEFMKEMEAHKEKAEKDRKIVAAIHKANKDRERMLQEAKGMVEKMKE